MLRSAYTSLKFTPDGKLVGDLGEALAAEAYSVTLAPPNTKDFDATDDSGRKIQIRTTQTNNIGLRKSPELLLALRLKPNGDFDEIYNGPGEYIWKEIKWKKPDSNGYRFVSQANFATAKGKIRQGEQIAKRI